MKHSNQAMTAAIHAPRPKPGHVWPDDPAVKYTAAQLQMAEERYTDARTLYIHLQGTARGEQMRLVMNYRYRLYQDAQARMQALEAITDHTPR